MQWLDNLLRVVEEDAKLLTECQTVQRRREENNDNNYHDNDNSHTF